MSETRKPRAGSHKFAFQDITKTNGQLLSIHHTITERNQRKRIQFVRCAFNPLGDAFVAVDHRGSIFLFNVARQFVSVLPLQVARCSCIKFHPCAQKKDLLLATKDGTLLLMEYNVETATTTQDDRDAFGWTTPVTEGIIDPEPPQLSFGPDGRGTTTRTAAAKIKLRTHPYPRGSPIINLSFPTSAAATASNPIISPKATSTRVSDGAAAVPLPLFSASSSSSSSNAFLSMTKTQCIVHDLQTFDELFHVDTADCLTLKQALYLPPFDYVLVGICGDNSLRVWGMGIPSADSSPADKAATFRRQFDVIAMREQYLKRRRAQPVTMNLKRSSSSENVVESLKKDFSAGHLTALACSRDTRRVIVATLDSTLVVLATNDGDFAVDRVLHLANEVYVSRIDFLSWESRRDAHLVLCRTNIGDLLLVDLMAPQFKRPPEGERAATSAAAAAAPPPPPFLVVEGGCVDFACAPNYKLFAVQRTMGEIEWYSLEYILRKMETELGKRNALMMLTAAKAGNVTATDLELVQREIQSLLPTKRLIAILNEYNEYPHRQIVWRSLLKLPHNEIAFCDLLRKGYHPCVAAYDSLFPLKSRAVLRNLKKVVSCLAFWSPAFAASDFVPHFVFPFLKVHDKNPHFTFEVCATVLLNHGQLLFEFAPLEPFNFLGMVENLVAHFDPKLMEFYKRRRITSKTFAWPLIRTAFAEVLDSAQWLQLWDHLITNAPDFMVFVAVAYNMTQRSVIMRLEGGDEVEAFFRDQNLIDMKRYLRTAYSLAGECPDSLAPKQYIRSFEALLSPVYQKFYNYPRKAVDEAVAARQQMLVERDALQAKMEEVSREENRMLEDLDRQLADEQHSRRLAEVERALDELRVHEAMETANKHHMALLCEREQRNKELALAADLNQCLTRKRTQARERELQAMLRELDKDRIGEQMELQLCEERRQMKDVEEQVKKRLVAFASTERLAAEQPGYSNTMVVAVKASEAAAAGATTVRTNLSSSRSKGERLTDNQSKLIKYSDRFRRN